jgi:hypothetical protein
LLLLTLFYSWEEVFMIFFTIRSEHFVYNRIDIFLLAP